MAATSRPRNRATFTSPYPPLPCILSVIIISAFLTNQCKLSPCCLSWLVVSDCCCNCWVCCWSSTLSCWLCWKCCVATWSWWLISLFCCWSVVCDCCNCCNPWCCYIAWSCWLRFFCFLSLSSHRCWSGNCVCCDCRIFWHSCVWDTCSYWLRSFPSLFFHLFPSLYSCICCDSCIFWCSFLRLFYAVLVFEDLFEELLLFWLVVA